MSDNTATALATTSLLIERVRELVESDFTEDQLSLMKPEEKSRLVRILGVGCFPHICCLLAKHCNEEEKEYLKQFIPVADQQLRLKRSLNSLLFAVQKNFRMGIDQYAKGDQHEFYSYLQENYPDFALFYTGRAGTGSRMDASFEVAYAIALNYKPYLNFLIHLARILPQHSTLSDSIRIRLGSVEFYAPLLCRARLWIKVVAPLRVLCNCHDLEDHNLRDMGDAMDNIEEAMLQLLENPSLLRDPAFRVFTLNRWPCLNEFYQSRIEKNKRDVFLADIEIERIFQCGDECEHLIDQLVVCNARGILKALYHNAHKFLTSCDGIYASAGMQL